MLLTNDGPGTIFLGDDSSLSTEYGLPLPPLASIVWEEGRSLWAVSSSTAVLKYGRTTNSPVGTTDDKQRVIYNAVLAAGSTIPRLESGSYSSLQVNVNQDSTASIDNMQLTITWRSNDGVLLSEDIYTSAAAFNATYPLRFTIPVKGAAFDTSITGAAGSLPTNIVIIGSTLDSPVRLRPSFNAGIGFPVRSSGVAPGILNYGPDFAAFTWAVANAANDMWLHNLGQTLTLTIVFDTIPGAGRISIRDKSSGATFARFSVSTTGAFNQFVATLPLSSTPELHWEVVPTVATTMTLALVWS